MENTIKNRSEILFIYDIENANPNGDPINENRPRFDAESSKVIVSDVRLNTKGLMAMTGKMFL